MRGECPNPLPDCKYYPNCYSDTDHLYGRPKGKLQRQWVGKFGIRQICRREHEDINACYVHWEMPSPRQMKIALGIIATESYDEPIN